MGYTSLSADECLKELDMNQDGVISFNEVLLDLRLFEGTALMLLLVCRLADQ